MKALTICQPYAELIARGTKLVENREWPTRYRGPLLIHAGKSKQWWDDSYLIRQTDVQWGAVIAVAHLAACLHIDDIEAGDHDGAYPWLREHEHTSGTWCWILTGARRFAEPVPVGGKQGLWEIEVKL